MRHRIRLLAAVLAACMGVSFLVACHKEPANNSSLSGSTTGDGSAQVDSTDGYSSNGIIQNNSGSGASQVVGSQIASGGSGNGGNIGSTGSVGSIGNNGGTTSRPGVSSSGAGSSPVQSNAIPSIVSDGLGGYSFSANGKQYVLWGVEDDQWKSISGNTQMIRQYIEASKYVNANCLAIHVPWRLIEQTKDEYSFGKVEYFLTQTEKAGLKAVIYFTSTDYAAGNMEFVPDYILNDTATYSRIQGDPKYFRTTPWSGQPSIPLCPSNPDLLAREKKAYTELIRFLKDYDKNHNVLAIQVGGEMNFLMALKDEWIGQKNADVRCECPDCNKAFQSYKGSKLDFMTQQYAVYIKTLIHAGAAIYDIPTYTCSAPKEYWGGNWRYAENSEIRKATVNKSNYFVGPSIAETQNISTFTKEMDHYLSSKIKGNYVWVSGIDTGHGTPGSPQENGVTNSWPHLEMAPWFNIFHYKGLGAIYWDHPNVSITNTSAGEPVREKFRAMWSPLRAASSILASYKSGKADQTLWWNYSETEKSAKLGSFTVKVTQNADKNYGFAFQTGINDIVLAATTYDGGTTSLSVEVSGGFNGYQYERGYFDDDGKWVKTQSFSPSVSGNKLTFKISGDHGDYTAALYRIHK